MNETPTSIFSKYVPEVYPHTYDVVIHMTDICAGTPADPKTMQSWLRTKTEAKDDAIRAQVAEIMVEIGCTYGEAVERAGELRGLTVFKRCGEGLCIEGRQVKAMIKEVANICWPTGDPRTGKKGWGPTAKGTLSYIPEHVFCLEDLIPLGVTEPTTVLQSFVHTFRGNGIKYEEIVEHAELAFTVTTDINFRVKDWAKFWLVAEQNGLGASRSQGHGRFTVCKFDKR